MRSTARSPARISTPDRVYASRRPLATATGRSHGFLQHELARRRVGRDGLRVVAVEAGEAEPVVRQVEGREHAPDRQVAERVRADELADLLLGMRRGDELGLDRRVDAVEARMED